MKIEKQNINSKLKIIIDENTGKIMMFKVKCKAHEIPDMMVELKNYLTNDMYLR